jgi:hypothetical protein
MSPKLSWSAFFDRTSDAFNSITFLPASLATNVAVVVLPIPGGPDNNAAFHGPLGALNAFS